MAGEVLADARTGKNGRHAPGGMLRQAEFGRLAGYEDVNDAERLWHDPAMPWIVGGKAASGCAASASQMGRFETRWLTAERNLSALADLSGQWIDKVHARRPPKGIVLDMDSSVSPTHGEQEPSVWNGHYECTCYHPLLVFNQFGDLERCALRAGNVHSADGWEGVLKPVVARYRGKVSRLYFRADAGFANPEVYEHLEGQGIKYAVRLPASRVLQERIGYLPTRPVGRPPNEVRRSYANFTYQAGSWSKPRRVVAKVEWHPGELYPRVGFIVTNMARPAENVVAFYNKRGTCEQWIKEGTGAIRWTRLSCRTFAASRLATGIRQPPNRIGNQRQGLRLEKRRQRGQPRLDRGLHLKNVGSDQTHGRSRVDDVALPKSAISEGLGFGKAGVRWISVVICCHFTHHYKVRFGSDVRDLPTWRMTPSISVFSLDQVSRSGHSERGRRSSRKAMRPQSYL